MKKLLAFFLAALCLFLMASCTQPGTENTDSTTQNQTDATKDPTENNQDPAQMETLRNEFLSKTQDVVINETTVSFTDASGQRLTIEKNPEKTVNLYASFTTLWYEAGGSVIGCIGGSSSTELYQEYIGRDITQDDGMAVVATSSSGKKWDVESIIALRPDLIICSTAMSGYSTIESPANAAGIPLIAVEYNDFSDYLKWFKVFCNLTGHEELWDAVALKALDEVVNVLINCPTQNTPSVFSMFSGSESLQANTSSTVVGGMINAMNAKNIVDSWGDTSGAERLDINLETVYAADPDIIVIQCHAGAEAAQEQVETLYGDNPVWNSLRAVKDGRVYYLEKTLFHNKPNSRFAEAYSNLAAILYPNNME